MPPNNETPTVGPLPAPEPARVLRVGSLVADRYEIREHLGRGGHAAVYRAFDRVLRVEVALKVLHAGRDPERGLARMRREVGVAREIASPHLARVFELGESDGAVFLTMELLRGGSLRERLRQGPLAIEEALRVAEAVLRGLEALHARGVVHRDVTPANVLFSDSGEVKLGDFGLVRRLGPEETRVSLEGGVLGTLAYLSPEQLLGEQAEAGAALYSSDLYSLGVILFEMLTGRLPHEVASEPGRRLAALTVAPDVRGPRPEVPRWLAEFIARLLERRHEDRQPSAAAALALLAKQRTPPRYRLRRWMLRAALAALLLLALAGLFLVPLRGAAYSHLVAAGETGIRAVNLRGEALWSIDGVSPEIAERATLARLTADGPSRLALVLARPGQWTPEAISTLSFLDPATGTVVREVRLPSGAGLFPRDPPRFSFASAKAVDLDDDGVDEVLVNYNHVPEAPFYTVLYAPRYDQARIVYYSRGGQDFQGAADLDGDGTRELLFSGIDNGWNWVNTIAAVRLDLRSFLEAEEVLPTAAPSARENSSQDRALFWFATIPRGHLESFPRLSIDEGREQLTVHYRSGQLWQLGYDGFPPVPSSENRTERQNARREAYRHLWEAGRLEQAGAFDLALSESQAAIDAARRAEETWLGQYAERVEAKVLVARGEMAEAERRFSSLMERAEDAPEVAYDAAVAFHLHGDLRRAVTWYERGMGRGSSMGAGKSKYEFLKGLLLVFLEEEAYGDALASVARFGATYPPFQNHLWLPRELIRWRSGETPQPDPAGVPKNWTDLERYWDLELAVATRDASAELLERVDRFLDEKPETRAEALSLRAELLARLGRTHEAAEAARSALALVRADLEHSLIARAHLSLVEERALRLGAKPRSASRLLRQRFEATV